jgi:hypothetical protein
MRNSEWLDPWGGGPWNNGIIRGETTVPVVKKSGAGISV